jgi:hypothetical protein
MRPFLLTALLVACAEESEPFDPALYDALPAEELPPPLDLSVTDLVPGQPVTFTATAAFPGDRIWFAYSLTGPGAGPCPQVFAGMCTDILRPVPMSSSVANAQGTATFTTTLPPTTPIGTDVWFQAFQYQGGSPYESDVVPKEVGGTCLEDGREDNDALGTATPVNPGLISNLRSCDGDDDWYAVQLDAGETIDVYLTFTHTQGDIDVHLTNTAGTWLASAASLNNDEELTFTAQTAGTYFIHVEMINDTGNQIGNTYSMDVDVSGGACVADPYEPNDAAGTAITLAPGAYQDLSICSVVQDDYFQIAVTPGQTVAATIQYDPNDGDLDLYMYDFNGGFLDSSVNAGASDTVSWTATSSTTVRVRVTLVWPDVGNTGNSYDLQLSRTP